MKPIKILLIIISAVLAATSCSMRDLDKQDYTQDGLVLEIYGSVGSPDGVPISGIEVSIEGYKDNAPVTTSKNEGKFSIFERNVPVMVENMPTIMLLFNDPNGKFYPAEKVLEIRTLNSTTLFENVNVVLDPVKQ